MKVGKNKSMILLTAGMVFWGVTLSSASGTGSGPTPGFDHITVNGAVRSTVTIRNFVGVKVGILALPLRAAVGDSVAGKFAGSLVDSVVLAKGGRDSIKLEVSPKGIIGIRTRSKGYQASESLDSAFSVWRDDQLDSVRINKSSGRDSVTSITLKPEYGSLTGGALDSLEIYPLGLRNGTVTIEATSRRTGRNLGTITVNVSDQRPVVAASTILAVPTIETTKEKPLRDTSGVRLRWTHPTNGPGLYEVLAFADSVMTDSSINELSTRNRSTFADDTLSNTRARSREMVTGSGTSRTAVLTDLTADTTYYILIRGVWNAAVNDVSSRLLTPDKSVWGGSTIIKIKTIGSKTTVTDAPVISYPTGAGKTYDGKAQDIGRATLVSGITDRTYGGLDPWDTTYIFASTPYKKAKNEWNAARLNDTARWASVKKPVDAGLCTTTVIFKNKSTEWKRTSVFNIAPRSLADGFIVPTPGTPSFKYTGSRVEPVIFVVADNLSGIPAERKSLEIGRDFIGMGAGDSTVFSSTVINDIDAGTAAAANGPKIRIKGVGNYSGTATKGFVITQKAIAVDVDLSTVSDLTYNGTRTVDSNSVSIVFKEMGYDEKSLSPKDVTKFKSGVDSAFGFTATLASGDVSATGVKAAVQVSLGKGSVAKNYSLSGNDGRFEKTVTISPKSVLDASDFKIAGDSIPTNHLYTGLARGIPAVSFGYAQPANTASITVLYDGDTAKPKDIGTYKVTAVINQLPGKTANYVDGAEYDLGTYEIGAPLPAVIDSSNLADTTVRSKSRFQLWVSARSPNGGTVNYRWYRNNVLIPGATGSRYTPDIDTVGSNARYFVRCINTVPNVQVPDTIDSDMAAITVIEAARSLKDLTAVTIEDSLIYNGTAQIPPTITVKYAGSALLPDVDYSLVFANNVNAGSGFVYIVGLDAYMDTILVNFPIARRKLIREDFFVNLNRTYNAAPQALTAAITNDPVTGAVRERLGAATFTYNGSATAPTNAGKYGVKVTFAQGTNFTASDSAFTLDSLIVAKKVAFASDFNYTIPTGHAFTGQAQGIGPVSIKGTGAGKLTVLYDYEPALPVVAGTYTVAVEVEGGENYTQVIALLGQYRIASDTLLVSEAKTAIESSGFGPVRQEEVNTSDAAVAHVQGIINTLELAGVTTAIKAGPFTAAVAGTDELPNGVAGTFTFTVVLEKGNAKDSTIAITLAIGATPVSIASGNRVIPGGRDESAVAAPVAVAAGEFTVGPNPVAKAAGGVTFFWRGKAVKSGTLCVFDGSGNIVAKVKVSDKGVGTARREIGGWGFGSVAEGTYLVKGALVGKDGAKVRVSSLVGVR